jgi:TonB family protein
LKSPNQGCSEPEEKSKGESRNLKRSPQSRALATWFTLRRVADLGLVRSVARLLVTLAVALAVVPHVAKCEGIVKGKGPILLKVLPDYPYAARDQHQEGNGLYRLNLKPDGTVSSVTVLKSTGHILLDQSAIHAFRQWRFTPGARQAVEVPITFTTKDVRYRASRKT